MTKSLQDLRKEAGYKTGKDFADECGMNPSTYARYEKDPSGIPLKSAWKMADMLGCSIDAVVGRDNPQTADERGEVQKRYDALSPACRSLVGDFIEFAESKDAELAERARLEREAHYMQVFRRYQDLFFSELDEQGDDLILLGTSEDLRGRFEGFITEKIGRSAVGEDEREGVIEGIMAAYDAFNAGAGGNSQFAYFRF